jgi:hypothetical protein
VSKNERQEVLRALDAWDRSAFREVTSHQSPLLDRALTSPSPPGVFSRTAFEMTER